MVSIANKNKQPFSLTLTREQWLIVWGALFATETCDIRFPDELSLEIMKVMPVGVSLEFTPEFKEKAGEILDVITCEVLQ